ncbi:hypothetical protein ACQKLX_04125 [Bosea sp. NPDC003192]|jgi:hypothetical protein|uniref:hypothetical protein n=1 Tax=Bosea sp. NPDC003192 TaxID=3390551 RepID=UPI003D069FCD
MPAPSCSKHRLQSTQLVPEVVKSGGACALSAAAFLALALSGCVTVAEQVSGEIEARRAACRQQVFKTNIDRAECHNAAEARLGEVWGGDLASVRRRARLVIAERQDRKELTESEAELAFAQVNADLTAQATRRAQSQQLLEAQYDAAMAQRRSMSITQAQPAPPTSIECVSRTIAGDTRTECRDNGVHYIRTNPAIR